jgi:uncharacterized protein YebE (UPF0316 family)
VTLDQLFASPWGALVIFCLRIVDVSADTMRVIFAIRGKRAVAALLGSLQALIWIFAVANAVKHLDSPLHVIGYAGGYGAGTWIGITLEQAIAYGVATVRVVTRSAGGEISKILRERGFGVTEFPGFGRDGTVEILNSVVQRSHVAEVLNVIVKADPEAFVTVEEPKLLRGGSMMERDWPLGGPVTRWFKGRQRA